MYKLLALLLGILIAVMLSINGVLSGYVGSFAPLPIIHIAGLLTVSLVLLFVREQRSEEKVPWYLNFGGAIGIFLVIMNNQCFQTLGASLTLSLGIIGQTLGSILADSTGFLGVKKYPFNPRKLIGLSLLLLGIVIMTDSWRGDLLNIVLAVTAGSLVILSMIVNSQLSLRIGIFHGVRRNYLVGLFFSVILLLFVDFSISETFQAVLTVNPVFILGGGICGVLIVAGSNKILPKIPVIYTTLLLFCGQALAGLIIDYIISGNVPLNKVLGILVLSLGLFVNMLLEKRPTLESNPGAI